MLSWDEFDTEEETVAAKPATAKAAASAAPDKLDNAAEAAVHVSFVVGWQPATPTKPPSPPPTA